MPPPAASHIALVGVIAATLLAQAQAPVAPIGNDTGGSLQAQSDETLRKRIESTPQLPFVATTLAVNPPHTGWVSGSVSWVTVDKRGHIYELQRGTGADPILELNCKGRLLRSWGTGDFVLPHSLRLDAKGHVWTVDASSSQITEYTREGRRLQTLHVGDQPQNGSPFHGATDIAFAPDGDLFVSDGYGNARILKYSPGGTLLRQWGKPGAAPGEFHLPHALQVDQGGTLYVADRENGRIELFTSAGAYLDSFTGLGRVYALKLAGDVLWATMGSFTEAPGSGDIWLVTLDRRSGRLLGHLRVSVERAGHALDLLPSGEPVITAGDGIMLFRHEKR